jgi:hypothetical protein
MYAKSEYMDEQPRTKSAKMEEILDISMPRLVWAALVALHAEKTCEAHLETHPPKIFLQLDAAVQMQK